LWGVAILSVVIHAVNSNFAFKGTSAPIFTQLVNEWTTQPFVSIVAVKLNNETVFDCPSDYPDEVINEAWFGQNFGCDCMGKVQSPYKSAYKKSKLNYANIMPRDRTGYIYKVG
jgi:hypothetical protein